MEPFIEGLDTKQADLSLLKGKAVLNNITLKREALVNLGLDLELISSKIEKIDISIPWLALFNDSMKIKVHGLEIHAVRKQSSSSKKQFTIQEMSKLKKEALKQTEAGYFSRDKRVGRAITRRKSRPTRLLRPT